MDNHKSKRLLIYWLLILLLGSCIYGGFMFSRGVTMPSSVSIVFTQKPAICSIHEVVILPNYYTSLMINLLLMNLLCCVSRFCSLFVQNTVHH